ncbi:MAG: prepilin-type N-terminal cleavage/methylation domain-containing protein [Deltaproteobacteria bacterium]|jgi:type IV pilus assembly protein PilV|nr:prepilin-type N-terminal cleavage/methylation domain-containing protein [Deltaproteobacteria bacterium]MDA8305641.1 prepilin-type N-terminal cleavage/methylation domain-containing protein [Deltaproteobacteria bacterium]
MEQTATPDNGRVRGAGARKRGGFTLIEVMVALVVLAVGLLGSVLGIMASLDQGVLDEMRSGGIKIAQEQLDAAANMPYNSIQTYQWPSQVTRQIEKRDVTYNVQMQFTPSNTAGNAAQDAMVQFTVTWEFKPPLSDTVHTYSYVTQTIVRQIQ